MALHLLFSVLAVAGHGGGGGGGDESSSSDLTDFHHGTYHYQHSSSGFIWFLLFVFGLIFLSFACSSVYYWQYPRYRKTVTVTKRGPDGQPTEITTKETDVRTEQQPFNRLKYDVSFDV